MDRKYKMIDDIMPSDGPITQHATEGELRIFHSTNYDHDVARLKPSGCLFDDVTIYEKKI